MPERVLNMGMIGGGTGAFIGAVHRTAACLDHGARFIAGALSSTPERAVESGRALGLADRRNYPTWRAMLEGESLLPPGERIDFVSIVTPNHAHFEPALAFVRAGFHVVCDKPMTLTSDQAATLTEAVAAAKTVFCVTYNYSGYPMVKQAREMIASGVLGTLRKVTVEYTQGWLASRIEASGQKQAEWRQDPARGGVGGAIGDIGSHAEHLISYTTGLEIESISADLTSFVPGRVLDDDASLLLRFAPTNGVQARGAVLVTQIAVGHENDLRLRVHGDRASLEWRQEDPNHLVFRVEGKPEQVLRRGNAFLGQAAAGNSRTPPGHPEGFLEAFANVYAGAMAAIRAGAGGNAAGALFDFPDVSAGARGVRFIEKAVENARGEHKWTMLC